MARVVVAATVAAAAGKYNTLLRMGPLIIFGRRVQFMAAVCVHFCVCPRAECRRRSNIQSINNRARSRNFAHAVDRSADENERVLCMHMIYVKLKSLRLATHTPSAG